LQSETIKFKDMKKYAILFLQIIVFMVLMSLFLMGGMLLLNFAGIDLEKVFSDAALPTFIVQEFVQLLAIMLAAFVILRFWEKKPFSNLGFSFIGRGKDLLWGMLTAIIIYIIGFGVSVLAGWVKIVDVGFYAEDFFLYLLLMILVGMAEELMCRGFVLGRMLNVGMHPVMALFLSSLFFAALHLGNDGVTVLSIVNITLAGMLLGVTYLYTHNLAFPIALHTFWNFIQGAVCGYKVSGTDMGHSVLNISLSDDVLMSGGEFGFEGSLVCTVLEVIFIVILLRFVGPRLKAGKQRRY